MSSTNGTRPDAEQAVLGGLLIEPKRAPELAPHLTGRDFNQPRHETIWRSIHAVTAAGLVADPVTVAGHLTRSGEVSRVGGVTYLVDLMAACPNPAQVEEYAQQVREAARQRGLIEVGTRIIQMGEHADIAEMDVAIARAMDTLDGLAVRTGPATASGGRISYTPLTGLFSRARQRAAWLVEPVVAVGRVTLLYSPGKHGKSLIAMETAAALATGRGALSSKSGTPCHVLYIDQEMVEEDWQDRLTDMGYDTTDEPLLEKYLHLAQLQAWPAMDTPAGGALVEAEAKRCHAAVVIIDTASKVVAGEENSNDTQQAFYRNTVVPLKRLGVGVLVLDHTGKDHERGARGGSAKTDNVDLAFELILRGRDLLTLRCTHARFRDDALLEPTFLRRAREPLTHVVEPYRQNADQAPGLRPTHLMQKVSMYVTANPGATRTVIEAAGLGKGQYVRLATDLLVMEGYLAVESGPRKAQMHRSIKPFVEDTETDD